nr:hypothetical protein [Tanacetum cinerariifolium]GEY54111.1 hypothetical protein [Tanacetum cinerariifolium]
MLAIYKADVSVEHKALNTSSYTRKKDSKSKMPGAKPGHRKKPTSKYHPLSKFEATKGGSSKASTGSKTSHLVKETQSNSTLDTNPSQPPASILIVVVLHKEDQLVQDVEVNFMDLDSQADDPIIFIDKSKGEEEDEEIHATKHTVTEDTSAPQPPSLSSLLTYLKELPSKLNKLTGKVKELNKHVHELEIKLPGDLKEISNKLEVFTSTVSSLTIQVVELKTLQWELPAEFLSVPT